jgi:hypothetical protein
MLGGGRWGGWGWGWGWWMGVECVQHLGGHGRELVGAAKQGPAGRQQPAAASPSRASPQHDGAVDVAGHEDDDDAKARDAQPHGGGVAGVGWGWGWGGVGWGGVGWGGVGG